MSGSRMDAGAHALGCIAEALGTSTAALPVESGFAELGVDSLVATRLKGRLLTELGIDVPILKLLGTSTPAGLVEWLRSQRPMVEAPGPVLVEAGQGARHEPFPLTDIQQAYWVGRGDYFELGNIATHFYHEYESPGLDVERLEAAWNRLVGLHEMLRAVIQPDGRQRILEEVPHYGLRVNDFRELSPESSARALEAVRDELSHQVMDPARWPLFDLRVSLLGNGRMRVHLSVDVLIFDFTSFMLIARQWEALYHNPSAELAPPGVSFREYVLAARARRDSEAWRRAEAYWHGRLADISPGPELPLRAHPGAVKRPRFRRWTRALAAPLWSALKKKGAAHGLTPSGILLAAYSDVLARYSRSPRFTLGITLFNRLAVHRDVDHVVGDFTSVDLLTVDSGCREPGSTFAARGERLGRRLWEDLDHSLVTGVEVQRELSRARGGSFQAGFPVVFTSGLTSPHVREGERFPTAWLGELVHGISQTPQVWLDHQCREDAGTLHVDWDAVEELFPEGFVDEMFSSYVRLLERLASEDAAWLERRPVALGPTQAGRHAQANDTAGPVPTALLHEPFLEQARPRPERLAVATATGGLSYGRLEALSASLASALHQHGARPETLVAVVMDKGPEQVAAVMGILRAGAAYLPIDASLPEERIHYLLENGEVSLALTQRHVEGRFQWPQGVRHLVVDLAEEGSAQAPEIARPPLESLAYVIYTSGSTGRPKGVAIEHRSALNTVVDISERFGVGEDDAVLGLSSLSFDLSVYDIFGPLALGASLVLPSGEGLRDPGHWLELMERHRVTVWNTAPQLLQMLVEYAEGIPVARRAGLRHLRLVMLSGDWIPVALPDRIRALAPEARVVSLGGATEASIWSIHHPIGKVDPSWTSIPYGRALRNQSFHVLDEALDPCPDLVPGDLYIGGIGLAREYWRDAEKTARSFIVHPRTGERLYRTGDLGRWRPDGNIEFLGRQDTQVKIRGYRVELGEVECAITDLDGVADAAVDAHRGPSGQNVLVGYVVREPGSALSAADLRARLGAKLPEFMVPLRFVFLDRLPVTSNGKLDRKALSGVAPSADASEHPEAGHDELAAQVLALIQEACGIKATEPKKSLLQLGATSLEVVRLAAVLERRFGWRAPIADLMRAPSVNAIAAELRRHAPLPPAAGSELISLPTLPQGLRNAAGASTGEAPFASTPIATERLAAILASLDFDAGAAQPGPAPVDVYLEVRPTGVAGVPPGTYRYDPARHGLVRAALGSEPASEAGGLSRGGALAVHVVGTLKVGKDGERHLHARAEAVTHRLAGAALATGLRVVTVPPKSLGEAHVSLAACLLGNPGEAGAPAPAGEFEEGSL